MSATFAEVGFLDIHRQAVRGRIELVRLVVVGVEFKQGCPRLIVQIDGVIGKTYFLREVIRPAVFAVHVEFHGHDVVCTSRTDEAGGLHTDGVRRHRPRLLVGQQHPVLALGEAKRLLLLLELQAIRVLIPRPTAPRRVAATLDLYRRGLHRWEHAGTVDGDGGIQIKVLALHHLAVLDVDIDAWHLLGTVSQPVYVNTIFTTERHHQVSILSRFNDFAAVIVGILLHLPQAELREHEVLPTCSLVQLDAQVAITAAEVYLRALPSLGSSLRQTVVIGCERAHRLPR